MESRYRCGNWDMEIASWVLPWNNNRTMESRWGHGNCELDIENWALRWKKTFGIWITMENKYKYINLTLGKEFSSRIKLSKCDISDNIGNPLQQYCLCSCQKNTLKTCQLRPNNQTSRGNDLFILVIQKSANQKCKIVYFCPS